MSAPRKLNVGLVGYGFMGRTHANAFGQVRKFFPGDPAGTEGHRRPRPREGGGLRPQLGLRVVRA